MKREYVRCSGEFILRDYKFQRMNSLLPIIVLELYLMGGFYMNWEARFKEGEQLVSDRRISEAIEHYKAILDEAGEDKKIYYWALKHLGDVIGYAGLKDYLQAIEIYQKIINEYEEAEDALYNWCQVDIARSYLEAGLEMFDNFSSMMGIFEFDDNNMNQYVQKLITKKNEYIEREAEVIYKERM